MLEYQARLVKYADRSELLNLFKDLDPRQITIVILRVGIGCDQLRQRDAGVKLNISPARVGQLENKVFSIMRYTEYRADPHYWVMVDTLNLSQTIIDKLRWGCTQTVFNLKRLYDSILRDAGPTKGRLTDDEIEEVARALSEIGLTLIRWEYTKE